VARRGLSLILILLASTAAAQSSRTQSDRPLSAIDWLSNSVEAPRVAAATPPRQRLDEPPVSKGAGTPQIIVTPLDDTVAVAIGTLPQSLTGLPQDLWVKSDPAELATLIQAQAEPALPALRDLFTTLLLAQADAPPGDAEALLLARIDKLLDLAALREALDLTRAADPTDPDLFRRWFDIALLTGTEDDACDAMQTAPGLAPTFPARIFCMARGGDWMAAALTLNTHRALGDVSDSDDALLSRFLDADLVDPQAPLPPPDRLSPLVFRMREAIGEGMSTSPLPLAFSRADLRDTVGEKARLDAAERLALHGALSAESLAQVMSRVTPAASGGVWDRLDAFQLFNAALNTGDAEKVAKTLPSAWEAMRAIRAEVPFATLYAAPLARFDLKGEVAAIATTLGLLSDDYANAATRAAKIDPFLLGIATGNFADLSPQSAMEEAIVAGFSDAAPPQIFADLLNQSKLGEALLCSLPIFAAGVAGDARSVTDALVILRRAGLDDSARRAALQLMLLDRAT